jgi:hypothetical protein
MKELRNALYVLVGLLFTLSGCADDEASKPAELVEPTEVVADAEPTESIELVGPTASTADIVDGVLTLGQFELSEIEIVENPFQGGLTVTSTITNNGERVEYVKFVATFMLDGMSIGQVDTFPWDGMDPGYSIWGVEWWGLDKVYEYDDVIFSIEEDLDDL